MNENNRINSSTIVPVILSGGSGTRLWPKSRKQYPKQLLQMFGSHSMLQDTALRVKNTADLIVVCNEDHRFIVAEQLDELGISQPNIILEPMGRNTAPAIAIAAMQALATHDDPILAILAADHLIKDTESFLTSLQQASEVAVSGKLVSFGIKPSSPETGYGYIYAPNLSATTGAKIEEFVEKPDLETATAYLLGGKHFWNSGMFVFRAASYLEELGKYAPEILNACEKVFASAIRDQDFLRLDANDFAACPSDSIDYAVMEKSSNAWMVPLSSDWNDIGSWSTVWDVSKKDEFGNVSNGDIILENSHNSFFESQGRLIAAVGVNDLVVVDTKDAVMIAHKDQVQDVKKLVDKLAEKDRTEHLLHREVRRPWGSYDSLEAGDTHQVKHITVKPGASLSLQLHHHRSEHWIVVSGIALVQVGETEHTLVANESIYIPLGEKHRLTNNGEELVHLIEVQCGSYLGEDDIVRFEDVYGRGSK